MTPSTAILLFSRSAAEEGRAKAFGEAGKRVAQALICRTERTLQRSGLSVYRSDESTQLDGDFGSKLAGAVSEVFSHGHRHLIVVSNDCPMLCPATLDRAARILENGGTVVGPDGRGGAYLIGLRAENFDADVLAALPWQTAGLTRALHVLLPDCTRLATKSDVNVLSDLQRNWRILRAVFQQLAHLLTQQGGPLAQSVTVAIAIQLNIVDLRGPPRG